MVWFLKNYALSKFYCAFVGVFLGFIQLSSQVTLIVNRVPVNTPLEDQIYLAGTMNGWNPGDSQYKLVFNEDSTYAITFTPALGPFKFKFTRGSWQKVEGTVSGNFRPDRDAFYDGTPLTLKLSIDGWEDISSQSSASPQVSVLSDSFYMPELNTYRRIWLYLPYNYETSGQSYKVLYMHDGQNLFDRYKSFAGEWGVDESLDSLINRGDEGCIVVGIENGGSQRLFEYTPWVNPRYGGGGGDIYIDFIKSTLKPYIDSHFRTKSDPENTGIMGSSLGGLISYYAAMKYPETFGRAGVFSPSFWYSTASFDLAQSVSMGRESYFYMMAGDKEGGNVVKDMYAIAQILAENAGNEEQIFVKNHSDGEHKEWYWRREFPNAYKWLFEKKNLPSAVNESRVLKPTVNYSNGHIRINNMRGGPAQLVVFDANGKGIYKGPYDVQSYGLPLELIPSIYFFNIENDLMSWQGVFRAMD